MHNPWDDAETANGETVRTVALIDQRGEKRPQGADPRVPGRKQDRGTDLVSKATREEIRAPGRRATSSFSQQTTDAREEETEEKKTWELPDGNITEVSLVYLRDW